jgi:hypothetical protein
MVVEMKEKVQHRTYDIFTSGSETTIKHNNRLGAQLTLWYDDAGAEAPFFRYPFSARANPSHWQLHPRLFQSAFIELRAWYDPRRCSPFQVNTTDST